MINTLKQPVEDYLYLINRQYPENESIKLVGNRHRLSKKHRHMLYRGLAPRHLRDIRKAKLLLFTHDRLLNRESFCMDGPLLHIDGYNVLFMVMNYLLGKFLFISNDGILRDSGESYGKIENPEIFKKATGMVIDFLFSHQLIPYTIYLDRQVSASEQHAELLERLPSSYGIHQSNRVISSSETDNRLKRITTGIIATSDSEIIDVTPCPIIDLPHLILSYHFRIDEKIINLDMPKDEQL